MRSAEDDDLEYGDEEDEEEESEEFEGQQQVIMDRGQQNRGDPRRVSESQSILVTSHYLNLPYRLLLYYAFLGRL